MSSYAHIESLAAALDAALGERVRREPSLPSELVVSTRATELLDVAVRTRMQTVQVVKVCDAFCDEFTATVRCSPIFSGDREVVERLHLVFESLEPNEQASLMSKFQGWCSGKWHCCESSTSPSSARSGATTRHDSTVSVIEDYPTASCSQG